MNWNDAIFQVIDLRSFSSVWYWLAVAVSWSTVSHWIIGVPFDLIFRARREGGIAADDLDMLVAINVRRLMTISDIAGVWLIGFLFFLLSVLVSLGFYYGFELAQGVFCLAFPLSIVAMLNMRKARRYAANQPTGADLAHDLLRFRFWIQVIAMISIFITAMYGMFYTLSTLPLL